MLASLSLPTLQVVSMSRRIGLGTLYAVGVPASCFLDRVGISIPQPMKDSVLAYAGAGA